MAKIIISYTAQFQGSVEVDTDDYEDFDPEDVIYAMTHEQLFGGCETDISLDVDSVEE